MRHSFPVQSLVCAVVLAGSLPANAQSFQTQPSPIAGIDLIGPDSPEFSALLVRLVPDEGNRAVLAPALPFSFIVRNSGTRTVRMITARFDYRSRSTLKPAAGILPQTYDGGLEPGSFDLFTPSSALTTLRLARAKYDLALRQIPELKASPVVQASVDSVVYADGELVGPDRSLTFQRLTLAGMRFRELLEEIRYMEGQPDSAVRNRLEQIYKEEREIVGAAPILHRRASARALLASLDHGGRQEMRQMLGILAANPPVYEVRKE